MSTSIGRPMFESIEQFKAAAEFFPKGRIIPQRILKGPRRIKHLWTFGSDSWALPTDAGYVVVAESSRGGCLIRVMDSLMRVGDCAMQGSPYTSGITRFIGDEGSEGSQLKLVNEAVAAARAGRELPGADQMRHDQ